MVTTIPPDFEPDETVSTHDLVEIRANKVARMEAGVHGGQPHAVRHVGGREVPPRRLVPGVLVQAAADDRGRCADDRRHEQARLVPGLPRAQHGQVLKPVEGEDGVYTAELVAGRAGAVPAAVRARVATIAQPTASEFEKAYLDRVIPAAVAAIRARELPGQELLNSVEMAEQTIPVSDESDRQGRVGRGHVDRRRSADRLLLGLRRRADERLSLGGCGRRAIKPGDPPGKGRQFARKTLQLNFWRPGDELLQDEREIRYGVPLGKSRSLRRRRRGCLPLGLPVG